MQKKLHCPRLEHFVRFNANGTVGKCGHMIRAPGFESWKQMQDSEWLQIVKSQMHVGQWPMECQRCQTTENSEHPHSIRLASIDRDRILSKVRSDYIILGGVLDNICNSACQSCNSSLSTKIGALETKDYFRLDNSVLFNSIPQDKIVELDLNGGEPTASPKYQQILENLPENVKVIRVNTNGGRLLPNIKNILERKIQVIITLSLDGVGKVHDYVRWPIKWKKYTETVEQYIQLRNEYKNLKLEAWTTVHALNVENFDQIQQYTNTHNIDHSWALLVLPDPLNPVYSNKFTTSAAETINNNELKNKIAVGKNNQQKLDNYIQQQDQLRNISIKDYL